MAHDQATLREKYKRLQSEHRNLRMLLAALVEEHHGGEVTISDSALVAAEGIAVMNIPGGVVVGAL